MGAWGTGIFEDDSALDFLDALAEGAAPFSAMEAALRTALAAEYLDYDEAQAALVSAAVIDAACRGVELDGAGEDSATWLAGLDAAHATPLRGAAAGACRRLLGPGSELCELWSDNEEDYPAWRAQIEALASRLSG
jgi:hypothetical protein